ncbi:sialidase family protein [Tahibacter harae]|uniref:Glycoside hydrolase n=1 Tax=Tahibacter harae TaxID=2963937 RepID=A0ABT1QN35_9GAMM|nr:sialidase family protein [Tahibacter harae]MCQ4163945.1 glycoside hydrolase [Tahibacter harae]
MKPTLALCTSLLALSAAAGAAPPVAGQIAKAGLPLSIRDDVAAPALKNAEADVPPQTTLVPPPLPRRASDRRISQPALDSIQTFAGTRPFVHTSVAEGTIASYGSDLVSVHSASGARIERTPNSSLSIVRNYQLAYSHSRDGGHSWTSAYLPPLPGSTATLGFGSVDVDRNGNFYVGGIGVSAAGERTVTVNKSLNGGRDFGAAGPVDSSGRVDKSWLAVGRDPRRPQRDNVYLTWVSFDDSSGASVLRFARSIDGGRNFTVSTVFAPEPDPELANPQNVVQFPMVTTDPSNGKVYIAFLQFGFVAQDYLRIHESDDGGETFRPVTFHVPGAPNAEVYPVTQPGTATECGAFAQQGPDGQVFYVPNTLLTLHAGTDLGGSASGAPRYQHATRVNLQPALAASRGSLHLAWSNSTSTAFGDPQSGARIHYLRSRNGGATWSPAQIVDTSGPADARQVMPAIALGRNRPARNAFVAAQPQEVHISYYAQLPDGSIVRRLAQSNDRGESFPLRNIRQLSDAPSTLAPSNTPLADAANPYRTTHYNRLKGACTSLGDYAGISVDAGTVHSVWGDSREQLTQPVDPLDPISGQVHARESVFYRALPVL